MAKPQGPPPDRQYWDACVFGAYINDEPDRAQLIDELLEECNQGRLTVVTSQFSIAEVAFADAERTNRMPSPETFEKIDALWNPPSKIKMVEVHELVAKRARDLMRDGLAIGLNLRGADAIHLASATMPGAECARVFTYDKKLHGWEELLGVPVRFPEHIDPGLFKTNDSA